MSATIRQFGTPVDVSRRGFLATSVVAGFTLATGPVHAQSVIVLYDGAPHGFHADYRPSYRAEAAKDGWPRCLVWFKADGAA